jgi:hypothetical protein
MRRFISACIYLLTAIVAPTSALGAATTLWSLYFTTPWMRCGDGVLLTPSRDENPIPGIKPCTFVGSGHGGDGADVFAMTAGRGTTAKGAIFPPGIGVKQGPIEWIPGYAPSMSTDHVTRASSEGSYRSIIRALHRYPRTATPITP